MSPDTYYRLLRRWRAGDRALRPRSRVAPEVERAVLEMQGRLVRRLSDDVVEANTLSRRALARAVSARTGIKVSPTAVRNVLLRNGWTTIDGGIGFVPPDE